MDIIVKTIQFKRGNAATWSEKNPVLLKGESGFELDTGKLKIGDGVKTWNQLGYIGSGDYSISADNQSISLNANVLSMYGFSEAAAGTVPSKGADGKVQWITPQGTSYTAGENITIEGNVISAKDTVLEILPVSAYGFDTNLRVNQQISGSQLIDKVIQATNVDHKQVIVKSGDYKYNVISIVNDEVQNIKGFVIETMFIPMTALDNKPAIEKCIFLYDPRIQKTCTFYEKDFTSEEINTYLTQIMAAIGNKQDVITDLDTIRAGAALGATAIQEHQDISGKLNVLPKVDDPTDPGYGWEYHIPYRFDVSLDASNANIKLYTITLDNKLIKMTFDKTLPSASETTAGLMSADDKKKLAKKLDVLPLVDDPTDPGFGWEYHIPYNFEATPDAEKINIKLKTLTLDNKFTKMNFDKVLPAATTETAGLMSAADKIKVNNAITEHQDISFKADLPGQCPPWLNPTGQTPYPWFMASLDVESAGKGPDAEGNLLVDVGAYNFNNKQYYKWEKSLPFAATTSKAGLMTAADKIALAGKQEQIPHLELTGTSGTLTDEQIALISNNTLAYILLDGVKYNLRNSLFNPRTGITISYFVEIDNTIKVINAYIGSKSWEQTVETNLQPKLTAGTNITIDNNVISATGGADSDNKTIIKGSDNKLQTTIGGWKETTPAQTTELFIDTKGDGSPTYSTATEIGWDYNTTISSIVGSATTASITAKFTVLGTTFNGTIALTKQTSIPAYWESSDLTIGGNVYQVKVHEGYVGTNQGGLVLKTNERSLDIRNSTMESLALITTPESTTYHPINNNYLNIDNDTILINGEGKLKAVDTKLATAITLGKQITAAITVGGITAGTVYSADTTVAKIIEDLLGGSIPPVTTTEFYYGSSKNIPTDLTGLTKIDKNKSTFIGTDGFVQNIKTGNPQGTTEEEILGYTTIACKNAYKLKEWANNQSSISYMGSVTEVTYGDYRVYYKVPNAIDADQGGEDYKFKFEEA